MKKILCLNDISISFSKKNILHDISFDINEGEIISLLGQSGSGKSTLLNIIAGFEKSNTGNMKLENKLMFDNNNFIEPQNRDIGFVFQNYALFPHMNVYDNITFGINHLPKKEQKDIATKLLDMISLNGFEKRYPHELSGGQQQRIALIRSLSLDPHIILLDEPFSGIDTMLKKQIQKELLEILRMTQKTAIIVTHDVKEAISMSDKIIYLENGTIVQYDTPKNILNNPKTENIRNLFHNI